MLLRVWVLVTRFRDRRQPRSQGLFVNDNGDPGNEFGSMEKEEQEEQEEQEQEKERPWKRGWFEIVFLRNYCNCAVGSLLPIASLFPERYS